MTASLKVTKSAIISIDNYIILYVFKITTVIILIGNDCNEEILLLAVPELKRELFNLGKNPTAFKKRKSLHNYK